MELSIALLLGQDGVTNGAIYALLALALVMVFAVTRVIFIPQGQFVAYGALTLAAMQTGKTPGTLWLLLGLGGLAVLVDAWIALRDRQSRKLWRSLAFNFLVPLVIAGLISVLPVDKLPSRCKSSSP